MLTNRRNGFSLIELLIAITVLGIVGLATSKIMRTMLSATAAQVAVAANQGNIRNGILVLPLEFREIGFDTIPLAVGAPAVSDLEAIAANRMRFRAMRGLSTTCGSPTLTSYQIRKPIVGSRLPLDSDGFMLFVESDPNYGLDDQWVRMAVQAINYNTFCGADSAITLTLSATPLVDSAAGTAMSIAQLFVGGPVRWYERMEYGPYVDPVSGEAFLGARSVSLGEAALQPMIGPLADTTGFALTYYNGVGTVLDPAVANPNVVRSIGVRLTGIPSAPVSLAGTARRQRGVTTVTTRVALRNTLRP